MDMSSPENANRQWILHLTRPLGQGQVHPATTTPRRLESDLFLIPVPPWDRGGVRRTYSPTPATIRTYGDPVWIDRSELPDSCWRGNYILWSFLRDGADEKASWWFHTLARGERPEQSFNYTRPSGTSLKATVVQNQRRWLSPTNSCSARMVIDLWILSAENMRSSQIS